MRMDIQTQLVMQIYNKRSRRAGWHTSYSGLRGRGSKSMLFTNATSIDKNCLRPHSQELTDPRVQPSSTSEERLSSYLEVYHGTFNVSDLSAGSAKGVQARSEVRVTR